MATSVTISPSRMSSYASAARGYLTQICSYARTGDADDLEDTIKHLRREVTRLETEARLVVATKEG